MDSCERDKLAKLTTALVADARSRLDLPDGHLDGGIRPAIPFSRIAGTAVTVRVEASNEASYDMSLYAEATCDEHGSGKVLVIQVPKSRHMYGIFGEGAATVARAHGFVGCLIEGAVRDTQELNEMSFPVFSRAIVPGFIAPKVKAVALNEPVDIGGIRICSGDVVIADNDGVIVVRPDELDDVIVRAEAIKEWEHKMHAELAKGLTGDQARKIAGDMP